MKTNASSATAATMIAVGLLGGLVQPLLADTATSVTNESCLAQCQVVLDDCKQLCAEVTSGTKENYKGAPGQQDGACLDRCEADFALCQKDC